MVSISTSLIVTLQLLLIPLAVRAYVEKPGPKYVPTVGHPWPMPKVWTRNDQTYSIDGGSFAFRVVDQTCDILDEAVKRYGAIVGQLKRSRRHQHRRRRLRWPRGMTDNESALDELESVKVRLFVLL